MQLSIQHSRPPSHQPLLTRPGGSQLPTEVLDIIVAHLTRRDLLSSSNVCKAWRPSASHRLWNNIDSLPLNEDFMQLIPTHGHLIHRLDLIFHSKSKLEGAPGVLLARVLQETPRLRHLSIQLLKYDSNDIVPPVLQAIKDYVSGQLTSLELKGMYYHIEIQDVKALFPSLTQLTRFEMDGLPNENLVQMLTSLPFLTAIALRGDRNTSRRARAMRRDAFQNVGIVAIGTLLPLLEDLTVHFNQNDLAVGLGHFSEFCPRLTRLDLRGCQRISSDGLTSFLGAQPHLTHVSLADTLLQDSGLLILATPARAAQLRVLNIRKCQLVQAYGVGQVVRACANLRELNFSLCFAVSLAVFAGTWACLGLLRLNFGGIHGPIPAHDGSDAYMYRVIREGEPEQMYAQLGRLRLLEELTLLPLPFQPRLFELGRASVENMTRLERISLVDRASALEDRDIIWLATRLPSLRTLDLDECTIRGTLLRDLEDINRSLTINLFYSRDHYVLRDPNLEDIDEDHYGQTDSDDSDSDSDSDSEGDNNYNFGIGDGGNDEDDSDDPYYSPGEEPYQPAHLGLYNSDDDDESANIYPYAIPSSNSDNYGTYDEDDDDDSEGGQGDNSFWDYRNSYYPNSDSDGPFANRDPQGDTEEGSKEDLSEDGSSGLDVSGDDTSSGSDDGDRNSQSELSSEAESDIEEDDDENGSSGSDVSGDGTSSGSEGGDRSSLSELSSEAESDTEEDDDEDGSSGSDVSGGGTSSGSEGSDRSTQSELSSEAESDTQEDDDEDGSEVGSSAENDENEQEEDEDEEDGVEQYSDDHYDEDDSGEDDAYDGYEDDDDDDDPNDVNSGGYDSDDY